MVTYLLVSKFIFNEEIVSQNVPISWWQSLPMSVPFFVTITKKLSLVPTPESTYPVDDTSLVCFSMLTHSLGGTRVLQSTLWLINLSRASISSLMINKSWPKFWGHEEVLLGNLLWNISQELTLTCELLYVKKKEFPFFDSLLIIFLSISSVLNLSQKVLSAISRNSLTKLRILFSSGSFESL